MTSEIVGGGWVDFSTNQEKYVRIKFKRDIRAGMTMTMFQNKKKTKEQQPDYFIFALAYEDKKNLAKDMFSGD